MPIQHEIRVVTVTCHWWKYWKNIQSNKIHIMHKYIYTKHDKVHHSSSRSILSHHMSEWLYCTRTVQHITSHASFINQSCPHASVHSTAHTQWFMNKLMGSQRRLVPLKLFLANYLLVPLQLVTYNLSVDDDSTCSEPSLVLTCIWNHTHINCFHFSPLIFI